MKIHTSSNRRIRRLHLETTTEVERLATLAEIVEAALADDHDHPPILVAATGREPTVEVLLEPLHDHPAMELEGFVAPSSWWCLGVVAAGRARALGDDLPPVSDDVPHRYPVHLAHVVSRSGAVARVLRDRRTGHVLAHRRSDQGGPATGTAATRRSGQAWEADDVDDADDGENGVIDDYLRLALGLSTPPPRRDTTELFAAMWIHLLMSDAADHQLLHASWAQVAALHPVIEACADTGDDALAHWATEHLDESAPVLAIAHPWERIRASSRDGAGPVTGRPAELAGWLDEGAFSRMIMSNLGPFEDLLADLHHLLPHAVHARVVDTIAGWDLLGGPGR